MNNANDHYKARKKFSRNEYPHERDGNAFVLDRNPERKRSVSKYLGNWEDNIVTDLRKYCVCRCELI
jgi:hypothetical protein